MSLTGKSANLKALDFHPVNSWSEKLPKVFWHQIDMTPNSPSHSVQEKNWDLSDLPFCEALCAVYPELQFTEHLRLISLLLELDFENDAIESLAKHYGFPHHREVSVLARVFNDLPKEFQSWSDEKQLNFSDLRPLLRKSSKLTDVFFGCYPNIKASKQQGCEILELLIDLEDHQLPVQLLSENSAESWLSILKKLRYPLTTTEDSSHSEQIRSWSWPSDTKGSWKRWGDKAGLSIQIQTYSPEDLSNKLSMLERISKEWREKL